MLDKGAIQKSIENFIEGTDKFLVNLTIGSNNVIIVVIDSDTSVNLDDCTKLSRLIESNLDRDTADFELSVYTAGLSEPLSMPRQYKKHIGAELEITTKNGIKQTALLKNANEEEIHVEYSTKIKLEGKKKKQTVIEQKNIKYETIATAKLVVKF